MEENLYLGKTHRQWAMDFAGRMDKLPVGSEDYEKCRKIFSWLCNQLRLQDRVNIEAIKNENLTTSATR